MESLTTKFAQAMAEIIKNHPVEASHEEIMGVLLAVGASWGKLRVGIVKTLLQLAIQMMIVSESNMDMIDATLKEIKKADAFLKATKTTAYNAMIKGTKVNPDDGKSN